MLKGTAQSCHVHRITSLPDLYSNITTEQNYCCNYFGKVQWLKWHNVTEKYFPVTFPVIKRIISNTQLLCILNYLFHEKPMAAVLMVQKMKTRTN